MRGHINSSSRIHPSSSRNPAMGGNGGVTKSSRVSAGTNSRSKITIKPFAKPPELPDNYYEETANAILKGTLQFLEQRCNSGSRSNSINVSNADGDDNYQYSLQSAYNNTVNLVSHQFGGRLYYDLVQTLRTAAEQVLQAEQPSHGNTMQYIVEQYMIYTDYLLLCKHVLTPLDRTWQWQDAFQKATPIVSTTSAPLSTTTTSVNASVLTGSSSTQKGENRVASSSYALQNIWQVGLTCFLRRLQELQLDQRLYQQWLRAFLNDWNGGAYSSSTSPGTSTPRQILQQVWYLWQDLGLLSQLTIQSDLEQYWGKVSLEWSNNSSSSNGSYPIAKFIQFCYDKHIHCDYYRQWLPIVWLWNVLDVHLFQPHLIPVGANASNNNNNNNNSNSLTQAAAGPTPLLLQDENLHPILQEAVFQQKHHHEQQQTAAIVSTPTANIRANLKSGPTNSKWSTVQVLWMLAGRLHGGQRALTAAIQRFARIQGLQCVHGNAKQASAIPATLSATTSTGNANAVQDLLHLQDSLTAMIQTLPMSSQAGFGGGFMLSSNISIPTATNANNIISLKSVWEEVVNVDTEPSIAEQLAKFLDCVLKSTKKIDMYQNQQLAISAGATGSAVSSPSSTAWLQRIVMGLFVPLSSKDVFEAFYKKDLAKRLLWNRVVSMDIEKQVCSLLKAECGSGYTSKMEGMFQDIEWSRETMLVYKESLNTNSSVAQVRMEITDGKSVEMEVQVLTTGYWPVYPQYPNLHLPSSFQIPQTQFSNHYRTKYQGRRMTWQYALGHCMVRAVGFNKPYDLLVSLCQALTLLQFTSNDSSITTGGWTLPDLQRSIGLDDRDEMERILQSLALGKDGTRILRKLDFDRDSPPAATASDPTSGTLPNKSPKKPAPPTKKVRMNVDDRDKFVINVSFDSNVRRIRINNILMKETKEEHDKTVEGISRDRLYLIDAVLVRIMKARKSILHQQLIPQVLEQIKIPALPADIKKRIESLIEREYMERDPKDRNRYNYLA